MKRRILCSCVNTDGTRCGRSFTDGSNPPICHIHRAGATGQNVGKEFGKGPQPSETPEEIVRKLLSDSDASVHLRAVDMWERRFENRNKQRSENAEWL